MVNYIFLLYFLTQLLDQTFSLHPCLQVPHPNTYFWNIHTVEPWRDLVELAHYWATLTSTSLWDVRLEPASFWVKVWWPLSQTEFCNWNCVTCCVASQKHMTTPNNEEHKVHRTILTVTFVKLPCDGRTTRTPYTPVLLYRWIWCCRSLKQAVELQRNISSASPQQADRLSQEEQWAQWPRKWKTVTLLKNYQTSFSSASFFTSALNTVHCSN